MIDLSASYWPERSRMVERLLSKKHPESRRIRRWVMRWCLEHDHCPVLLGLEGLAVQGAYPSRIDAIIWDLGYELARDDRLSDWDQMPKRERERKAKRIVTAAKVLIDAIEQIDGWGAPTLAESLSLTLGDTIDDPKLRDRDVLPRVLLDLAVCAAKAVEKLRPVERFGEIQATDDVDGRWSAPEVRVFARRLHRRFTDQYGSPADSIVVDLAVMKYPEAADRITVDAVRTWTGRKPK